MSFKRAFERNVNKELQGENRSQRSGEAPVEDVNIKKHHDASRSHDEEEDYELSEKKDRPPRFSTLFAGPPPPVIVERDPPREKRSGVFVPMPLFILFAVLLFLMSTFLFAYTIIGLYNNRPAGLLDVGGPSPAPIDGCNCAEKQAGINIAPNFVLGDAKSTTTVTITASRTDVLPDSETSRSSSTSLNQKSEAKAVASQLQSMLSTLLPSKATTTSKPDSTKIVTVTPPPSITKSTTLIAVDPNGNTITLSSTTKSKTTSKPDDDNNADKDANKKSVTSSVKSAADADSSNTETHKATTSPSKKDKPSSTEKRTSTTSKQENAAGPTACDPLDLVNNCQH